MKARKPHAFKNFVGVDLGGGKGKNTAVAVLERHPHGARVLFVGVKTPAGDPFYDDGLIAFLREYAGEGVLAVDAPLLPTVCVRCRLPTCLGLERCPDPVIDWFRRSDSEGKVTKRGKAARKPRSTPYTQRACEVVLHRDYGILPRETLGQGMGPLTARAHYLCRALEDRFELNRNLIEVYPKATLQMLFGAEMAGQYKRHLGTWRTRAKILEALSSTLTFEVWREGCLSNDHCFDAVICAYTAFLWSAENWQLPETDREIFTRDGWIWIPPAGRRR